MFSADCIETGTSLPELAKWVRDIADLTQPDEVVWCDGSDDEWDRLTGLLVENGPTQQVFEDPQDPRTQAYVTGRMG